MGSDVSDRSRSKSRGGERIIAKVDSEAAKSFVARRGLGRMRHIEVRDLWLQEEVRNGKVKVEKILGRRIQQI